MRLQRYQSESESEAEVSNFDCAESPLLDLFVDWQARFTATRHRQASTTM
jgi:hypothetical protein